MIDFHTHHLTHKPDVLELLNVFPHEQVSGTIFSSGLHPWHLKQDNAEMLELVKERLSNQNCIAVGETGLDRKREIPLELQREIFLEHLHLAAEFKKPVLIHCVAAHDVLLSVLKQFDPKVPMIIHGFSKNARLALQLLDAGFYLSFGIRLLQSIALQKAFVEVPDDRFFLETDSFPVEIEDVYQKAADLRNLAPEDLNNTIRKNFTTVFGEILG